MLKKKILILKVLFLSFIVCNAQCYQPNIEKGNANFAAGKYT